jgi:hypothetical protein
MKLNLLLSVLIFGVVSIFAAPKIEVVGGITQDWGDVKPSSEALKHTVTLKNVGDEPLNISGVKPSCGCTTAPIDKDILKPGETASIDVSFKAGTSTGPKTKTIRITSNDPSKPILTYRLKANVVKDLSVGPSRYFNFSEMEVGKKAESKVTITNNGGKSVTLSDFVITPNIVQTNLTKPVTLKPGEKVDVTAWLTPEKAGYTSIRLTMKTDNPDDPKLTIQGYGTAKESAVFRSNSK